MGGDQGPPASSGSQSWQMQPQFTWPPDKRVSDHIPFMDELEMRMRARIINDILKGKINLDDLQRGQQMNPQDNSLPNEQYFRPMA